VCADVAIAMAEGALERSPASIDLAITGVAGPERDEDGNPVGFVCIAAVRKGYAPVHTERHYGKIGRSKILRESMADALHEVLRQIEDSEDTGTPDRSSALWFFQMPCEYNVIAIGKEVHQPFTGFSGFPYQPMDNPGQERQTPDRLAGRPSAPRSLGWYYHAGIDSAYTTTKVRDPQNLADAWDLTWLTALNVNLLHLRKPKLRRKRAPWASTFCAQNWSMPFEWRDLPKWNFIWRRRVFRIATLIITLICYVFEICPTYYPLRDRDIRR
jgi:hypothetical protein